MTDDWLTKNRPFVEFIRQETRNSEPTSCRKICRDFIERTGDERTITALEKQLSRKGWMFQYLDFDMEDKIRMCFKLGVSITDDFLNTLEQSATVDLDDKQKIQFYEAHDGSLKLVRPSYAPKEGTDYVKRNEEPGYNVMGDYPGNHQMYIQHSSSGNPLKRSAMFDSSESYEKRVNYGEKLEVPEEPTTSLLTPKKESLPSVSSLSGSTAMEKESESALIFLKQLQSLVGTLDSIFLLDFQREIEEKMRNLSSGIVNVPPKAVIMALESALHYVVRNSTKTSDHLNNSISLREFILVFRAVTYHISDFGAAINDIQKETGYYEKRVTYQKIQFALEYAIGFVLP